MKHVLSQLIRLWSGRSSGIAGTSVAGAALLVGAVLIGSVLPAHHERVGVGHWFGLPLGVGTGPALSSVQVVEDAEGLAALFASMNYQLQDVRNGQGVVPAVFLSQIPVDLRDIDPIEQRKSLFFKALLPLVLDANETIRAERARLEQLANRVAAGKSLSTSERLWLARLADRYEIDGVDFGQLLRRVDIVPPSLALAQAAIESGWGSSRFAREGHALFGQKGPAVGDEAGSSMKDSDGAMFRSFEDPREAVHAYIHNLNTHSAYRDFRMHRAAMRVEGKSPNGDDLAPFLARYSERGKDYVRDLHSMIRMNGLRDLDDARLDGRPIHVIVQGI